ncbi:MAG: lysyl oxidase family protein [Candidatus Hydrogenedentota bacterium]
MIRVRSGLKFCLCMTLFALAALAQDDVLPDLFFDDQVPHRNEIDSTALPGHVLFRFDTSLPNNGPGEFRIRATGTDIGDGRQTVNQVIQQAGGGSREVDAGDFLYNTSTRRMENAEWVHYKIRALLPDDGVGDILAIGGKQAVNITSSAVYDLSRPNAPPPNQRLVSNGPIQGISVGYTDLYPKALQFQWVDVTGLPSGEYWLNIVVDPMDQILESDNENNSTLVKVTLDLPDGDDDGLSTTFEEAIGTSPTNPDSDDDGVSDGDEVGYDDDAMHYNPYDPDGNPAGTDLDALAADTDGDGASDLTETTSFGLDPLNPDDGGVIPPAENPFVRFLLFLLSILRRIFGF